MKTDDTMLERVEEYLRYRRALGYALRIEGEMLLGFGRFADQAGHRGPLTSSLAIRWARLPAKASRIYWAKRLEAVVGFARYCRIFDDRSQIPSKRMFGPAHRRNPSFLYSQRQLRPLADPGPDSDCPGN